MQLNEQKQDTKLTIKEAAAYLKISVRTLERILDRGEIGKQLAGFRIRHVLLSDLEKYEARHKLERKTYKGQIQYTPAKQPEIHSDLLAFIKHQVSKEVDRQLAALKTKTKEAA
jgi:excisionase family DNA binding protein